MRMIGFLVLIGGTSCAPKRPVHPPVVPTVQPPIANPTLAHLLGAWEREGRGVSSQMVFEPGGQLSFGGDLQFFNPARWSLDTNTQELKITLPNAPDEKLDIFHMYLGEGVKAFDRAKKEVTYHFDDQTWTLNIAGWMYSKVEKQAVPIDVEPVVK